MQNMRAGQCTLTLVRISYNYSECALSQSRKHSLRLSEAGNFYARTVKRDAGGFGLKSYFNLSPNSLTSLVVSCIAFTSNYFPAPVGNRNPLVFAKEERALQKNATDGVVRRGIRRNSPIALDPGSHLLLCSCTVFEFEGTPRKASRQNGVVTEEASSHNIILRTVQ